MNRSWLIANALLLPGALSCPGMRQGYFRLLFIFRSIHFLFDSLIKYFCSSFFRIRLSSSTFFFHLAYFSQVGWHPTCRSLHPLHGLCLDVTNRITPIPFLSVSIPSYLCFSVQHHRLDLRRTSFPLPVAAVHHHCLPCCSIALHLRAFLRISLPLPILSKPRLANPQQIILRSIQETPSVRIRSSSGTMRMSSTGSLLPSSVSAISGSFLRCPSVRRVCRC